MTHRTLTHNERLLLAKLVDALPPSYTVPPREQLLAANVEANDVDDFLKFIDVAGFAPNGPGVPVEAATLPCDQPSTINVLLHVTQASELFALECYRNDGNAVTFDDISVEALEVYTCLS